LTRTQACAFPGCWNGFELAVRAILGQQVSVKGATTLAGRLVSTFGSLSRRLRHHYLFPEPQLLPRQTSPALGCRLPEPKPSGFVAGGMRWANQLDGVVDSADFLARLCEIPGIGKWTAEYVAMRALGEPTLFPPRTSAFCRAYI